MLQSDTIPQAWFDAWANMTNAAAQSVMTCHFGAAAWFAAQSRVVYECVYALEMPSRPHSQSEDFERRVIDIRTRKPWKAAVAA